MQIRSFNSYSSFYICSTWVPILLIFQVPSIAVTSISTDTWNTTESAAIMSFTTFKNLTNNRLILMPSKMLILGYWCNIDTYNILECIDSGVYIRAISSESFTINTKCTYSSIEFWEQQKAMLQCDGLTSLCTCAQFCIQLSTHNISLN